jgi:phosphoribosylglycinamide formyltransferase-1
VSSDARLAILISGRGSNMVALARACEQKQIPARVDIVIADKAEAPGLALARDLGLQTQVISGKELGEREAFNMALGATLAAHDPAIIALAGFMRILPAVLVTNFAGRMLNIHPALLPKYRGLHTHRRVLEAGDEMHGASVHFVIPELDAGPVILQSRLRVRPGENEHELSARVQATEHIIYPRAVGWLAQGRLAYREGRAWFDGRPLDAPMVESFESVSPY